MNILTVVLYVVSLVAVWFGAGLIIKSVDHLARKLRLSSFAVSFFVLGILTSIPEIAVGFQAVSEGTPEVFVGTLLGGVVVIFLLIIPLLAILGRGIKINHDLDDKTLLTAMAVMALPGLLIIDHKVSTFEGLILMMSYGILFYIIQRKHGIFAHDGAEHLVEKSFSFIDLAKVMLGMGMVFVSSRYIVEQTIVFSEVLDIPAFYLSLILLGIGTNLPELSIAIRAVLSGKKDIAFGDYLGSASANTLLFGFFTLLNNGERLMVNKFLMIFVFMIVGFGLFFYFSKSRKDISRREGLILLAVYVLFVAYELWKGVSVPV